jgi:hypothetical protein
MKNVVVLWRDGRDVMISWYHHCLIKNDRENERLVNIVRKDLPFNDYQDVEQNLPAFIEYSFTRHKHPNFSWSDFVRRWIGHKGVTYGYYERLRSDTASELQRIVIELTGQQFTKIKAEEISVKFSFAQQAGRKPGQEDKGSFMRKGIVGDWRNYFNGPAREVFNHFAGNELNLLGYERDASWVRNDSDLSDPPELLNQSVV